MTCSIKYPVLGALALSIALCLLSARISAQEPPKPSQAAEGNAVITSSEPSSVVDDIVKSPIGPAPYTDRLLSGAVVDELARQDEEDEEESSGPARALHVDFIMGRTERGDSILNEQGLSLGGYRTTSNLGDLSFDLDLTRSTSNSVSSGGFFSTRDKGGTGISGSLWQRNFVVSNHWVMNNGFGVLNTPQTGLMRQQYRFTLPSVPFLGVSSELQGKKTRLLFSTGRLGTFDGSRLMGFQVGDGRVDQFGVQVQWSPSWSSSATYLSTSGVIFPNALGGVLTSPGVDTKAVHVSTRWTNGVDYVQGNIQLSDRQNSGLNLSDEMAFGAWIDAQTTIGRHRHNYGVFRLDPNLSWGAFPINSNLSGGYYRWSYQYGEWSGNVGVDHVRPTQQLSGLFTVPPVTTYVSGYLRRQSSVNTGWGVSGGFRQTSVSLPDFSTSSQHAMSIQAFIDRKLSWGQSRFQAEVSSSPQQSSKSISWDHAFPSEGSNRISVSTTLARDTSSLFGVEESSTIAMLALNGSRAFGDSVMFSGSMRYSRGTGSSALKSVDANMGLSWDVSPRWTVSATYFQSSGSQRQPIVLDPLSDPSLYLPLPKYRSAFLSVRYNFSAGRPYAQLGGSPGGGVGNISGVVFLDENRNGRQDASELPVSNTVIILDGKFALRTNDAGRYNFDRVGSGNHSIQVAQDNLPLPWSFEAGQENISVIVNVRENVVVDFGAQRPQ